jgi:hypothetical protein
MKKILIIIVLIIPFSVQLNAQNKYNYCDSIQKYSTIYSYYSLMFNDKKAAYYYDKWQYIQRKSDTDACRRQADSLKPFIEKKYHIKLK